MTLPDSVAQTLTPARTASLLALFRGFFLFACPLLALHLALRFAPWRAGRRARAFLFPALFCAGLLAILAHQALWQIFGFASDRFVPFMERYNPRPDNAAHRLVRGSVLDRRGRVLAETAPDGSGLRVYPYAEATAHVVGFRHPRQGLTGVEGAADSVLSGYRELRTAEDFREAGRLALQTQRHVGTNVTLTVDAALQLRASTLLRGRRGAAVALDPRTGDVLLCCSSPSWDPNAWSSRLNSDPDSPLLNRALQGLYPAGSTFKTAIAAMLVASGRSLLIDCPGEGFRLSSWKRPIRDHEWYSWEKRGARWPGFGVIGLDKALAKSSNVYFAHAGVACGTAAFNAMADALGLRGRFTLYENGDRRIATAAGRVPVLGRAEKRELAQLSIGQGRLLLTPMHLCALAAAIANSDGAMMRPRIVLDGKTPPKEASRPFSPAVAARVRDAMRAVTRSGTARAISIAGLDIGAKTGTAQNPHGKDHAWFICWAAREGGEPEIAVAVVVENAGFGSAEALPVARGVLEQWFSQSR